MNGLMYFYHPMESPTGTFWHVLHRWNPSTITVKPVQIGRPGLSGEGYLSIKAKPRLDPYRREDFDRFLSPKIFIDMSGNFRIYDQRGSLYLPMKCEACPFNSISVGGDSSKRDCVCPTGMTGTFNANGILTSPCIIPRLQQCPNVGTYFTSESQTSCLNCAQVCASKQYTTGCDLNDVPTSIKPSCSGCTKCSVGQYMITGATQCSGARESTMDIRGCANCTSSCKDGEFISGTRCDGTQTSNTQICSPCTKATSTSSCPVGSYISGTPEERCDGRGFVGTFPCSPCDKCAGGLVPGVGYCNGNTRSRDQKCTPCRTCGSGFYRSGGCTLGSDLPICTICQNCAVNFWISKPCPGGSGTNSTDRSCVLCGTCPKNKYIANSTCLGSGFNPGTPPPPFDMTRQIECEF